MSVKTIVRHFCDVCVEECQAKENDVIFNISSGDGRDVGHSTIEFKVVVNYPYGRQNGLVCKKCQKDLLAKYIESI